MAPAATPVPQRVLENVVSTLAGITAGPNHFHTILGVHVGKDPMEIHDVPAINIGDVGSCGIPESMEGRGRGGTMFWIEYEWVLPLFVVCNATENPIVTQLELVHDVHRALMDDQSRGGHAMRTVWMGWRNAIPPDEHDVRVWVEVTISVRFRHHEADMTQEG